MAIFEHKHFSQGSVATLLRHGGKFNYGFTRKWLLSLLVKEVFNSDNIWWRYR